MRNLAARAAMMANSGGGGGYDVQDYVGWGTSDLIAMFDGIRNVGATAAHDSTSTTWVDLTGNGYDLNRTYNSYTDGTFTTDALVQGSYCAAYGSKAVPSNANVTVEAALEFPRPLVDGDNEWIVGLGGSVYVSGVGEKNRGYMIVQCLSSYGRCGPFASVPACGTSYTDHFGSYTLPAKESISCSRDLDVINGVECSKNTIGSWGASDYYYNLALGMNGYAGYHVPASSHGDPAMAGTKYFSIRIYGRVLTLAERLKNYAIDKARFGLS